MIKIYKEHHAFDSLVKQYTTNITVFDTDTLGAASNWNNACCLNFASHKRPGGGYKAVMGTRMPIKTQEEDLFRRSNLPDLMDTKEIRQHYPLEGLKGIYTTNIMVDKDERLNPCTPFYISLVTVPAVVNPSDDDKPLIEAKVRRILDIAAAHNHPNLILGAWGCGVFNNDPQYIATLFKTMLKGDFDGVFESVVFAIPGKNSSNAKRNNNHHIFESVLNG